MDIAQKIIAEEIANEWQYYKNNSLVSDASRSTVRNALTSPSINLATRFALCDYNFDSNEFLTACGVK